MGGSGEYIPQPGRGRQVAQLKRIDPEDGIGFLACSGFAADPTADERRDHIMGADSAAIVADDRLDMIVESDDLRLEADFLIKLPQRRLAEALADFHDAAGQRIEAAQRRPRATRDERAPLAKDGKRDRKYRARRVKAIVQGGTSRLAGFEYIRGGRRLGRQALIDCMEAIMRERNSNSRTTTKWSPPKAVRFAHP
jgi:hypothetical protein